MSSEITELRNELTQSNNHETSFLRGCIADIVRDKADRNLLYICLTAGVLQDFFQEANLDNFFIRRCKKKLIEEFFITESAAEKAVGYCKFLTGEETETELIPYRKGEKWGYCNADKEIVIECIYDDAYLFTDRLAAVSVNDKCAYIDKNGRTVVPFIYDQVHPEFFEGLAAVSCNEKWSIIDIDGNEITGNIFDEVNSYSEGMVAVCINEKWGFVDQNGTIVVPCTYDSVESFSEGMAAVSMDNKWGFIDITGKEVVSPVYDRVESFSEGLAVIEISGKFGFINKIGKVVIPCHYSGAYSFSEGLAAVTTITKSVLDRRTGYIDKDEKVIIPFVYNCITDVSQFSEGLAFVNSGEKWGYIDKSGNIIIPFTLDPNGGTNKFSEGLAWVSISKKKGFYAINKTGKIVIHDAYDYGLPFSGGLAMVKLNSEWGFINKLGEQYWED